MEYKVKHGLSDRAQVRTVVEKAYEAYKERLANYNPSIKWVSDRAAEINFSVKGMGMDTKFVIDDDELHITGKIPWLFKPFERKILDVVGNEVDKWLAKARKGEI